MKQGSKIICYGDSNTFGYDPRGIMGFRYPKEYRWVDLLSDYGYQGINEGQNGREFPTDRTGYGSLQTILKRNQKADFLVIMLGANDLMMMQTPSERLVVKRVLDMFEAVPMLSEFKTPEKGILLIASPPFGEAPFGKKEALLASQRLGHALGVFAKQNGLYFADAGTWDIELAYDKDHFSQQGHVRFAKKLASFLDDLNLT